jgi:uncharacterized membrane protein HdeD (DUF308 family)
MKGVLKGLFDPKYGIARGIVALVMGVALVMWPSEMPKLGIKILGYLMILFGGVSIISALVRKRNDNTQNVDIAFINGIVVAVIGIIMVAAPKRFINFAFIIVGIMLAILGVNLLASIFNAKKYGHIGWGYYLLPVLTLANAALILAFPIDANDPRNLLFYLFGISMIIYGAGEVTTSAEVLSLYNKFMKSYRKSVEDQNVEVQTNPSNAKPVEKPAESPAQTPAPSQTSAPAQDDANTQTDASADNFTSSSTN